jgi:hypothetical protein
LPAALPKNRQGCLRSDYWIQRQVGWLDVVEAAGFAIFDDVFGVKEATVHGDIDAGAGCIECADGAT